MPVSAADPPLSAAYLLEGQCFAVDYGESTAGKMAFSDNLVRLAIANKSNTFAINSDLILFN
ncbi:MAG: hypothetical protein FJY65_10260 [Calditrichaeota bacterium]|nr:hypothetical protein [Calditrichota bacterium]